MVLSTLKADGTQGTATVELLYMYKNGREIRRYYGCIVKNDANLESCNQMHIKQSADKTKFKNSKYFVCMYGPGFEEERNEATVCVSCHRFSKPSRPKKCELNFSLHNFVKVQDHIFIPCDSQNFNDSTFLEKHSKKILEAQDLTQVNTIFGLMYDIEKKLPKFIPVKLVYQLFSNVYGIGAEDYEKLEDAGPILLQDNKTVVGSFKKRGNYEISISVFGNNQDGAPGDGTGQAAATPGDGTEQAAATPGDEIGQVAATPGDGTGQAAHILESAPGDEDEVAELHKILEESRRETERLEEESRRKTERLEEELTPECGKDVAIIDNVNEEKAYAYWFPRQAHEPQVEEFGRCENFALDYEHQVPYSDFQEFLRKMKHSIGAIIAINISEVPECGATCFRIGTKYVITNKHVVDDIRKSGIQSWSRCRVDFNYKEQVPQPAASFLFNFAPNPVRFYSQELDYVILELRSNGEGFPPSVTELGYNIAPPGRQLKSGECLTFIGHPGGDKKLIDDSCPIKLQQDIQNNLHNYDASTITSMLKACNHPDHVTYDVSTFFKGASGSPGILMKKKLLVVLHKGGFENRALEYGILMSSVVKDVMAKIENAPIQNVLDDIFGGSTSSIIAQCSLR